MSSESEIFALIGRVHVLMRRNLNRIADVDYMQANPEYARTILTLAEQSGHEELALLAERLRLAMGLFDGVTEEAPPPAPKYLFTLR